MPKKQISLRISEATAEKLIHLQTRYGTQAEAVAVAIDRLHGAEFSDAARLHRGDTDVLCAICDEHINPQSAWQPGIYQEICCPGCLEREREPGQPGA